MSERLTDNPTLFRLRVRYGKRDRLKYLGHLEVIHTIERIVRRAGLPYAVTQGFSPHMRVGFFGATGGYVVDLQWYDLFMTEFVALDEAFGRLVAASPVASGTHRGGVHRRAYAGVDGSAYASVVSHRPALGSRRP